MTQGSAPGRPRVLVVEDDAKLADQVRAYLSRNGFHVDVEGRGDAAAQRILDEEPDLVVLDLMLPGMSGLAICREVRARYSGSILMLTARGDEVDEIVGLEVGADDYLAKPVRPRLLLARINTLLRRQHGLDPTPTPTPAAAPPAGDASPIVIEELTVNPTARSAHLRGVELELTTAEFDLLLLLTRHAGQVLRREEIYRALRGIDWDGRDRSIDLRIARLRRKLGDDASRPSRIKSVRGVGYLYAAAP